MKPDRFGYSRCSGYNAKNFKLCPQKCYEKSQDKAPSGLGQPDPKCPTCGGYGEVPV